VISLIEGPLRRNRLIGNVIKVGTKVLVVHLRGRFYGTGDDLSRHEGASRYRPEFRHRFAVPGYNNGITCLYLPEYRTRVVP
jgi:hypothetical protein